MTELLVVFNDEADLEWMEEGECLGLKQLIKEFRDRRWIQEKERGYEVIPEEEAEERPVMIDGITASAMEDSRRNEDTRGPRRSTRTKKPMMFFDQM